MLSTFRILLLGLVVCLIHTQHARFQAGSQALPDDNILLATAKRYLPEVATLSSTDPHQPTQFALTESGRRAGYLLRTSPQSDLIIGYSGPNDMLVVFDDRHRVLGVEILSSSDTPEYVNRVGGDERFLASFEGMTWEEFRDLEGVEGVSGATLTSVAMTEAVVHRIRGPGPSLRFPKQIKVEEAGEFFPAAATLESNPQQPNLLNVRDVAGDLLGWISRTSPHGDNVIGYQGPTDILVAGKFEGNILGFQIRDSFETADYLNDIKDEESFMKLFNQYTLRDLDSTKFNPNEVEGVSGATMTSQAIAHSLKAAAAPLNEMAVKKAPSSSFRSRDLGTITILVMAVGMAFTECRGKRWLRRGFQGMLIVYLGFINGDLLSQALWVGWAQNGVPWRQAPGLAILTLAALLVPLGTRRQLYCHHICPHGAAQQMIKDVLPKRFRLPQRWARVFKPLPFLLLGLVVVMAMGHGPFNLSSMEPFEAYAFRIAGAATMTIAVGGLVSALFVPMAYCRYGCPTGALLKFLWAGGRHGTFTGRDSMAVALVLLAAGMRFWG